MKLMICPSLCRRVGVTVGVALVVMAVTGCSAGGADLGEAGGDVTSFMEALQKNDSAEVKNMYPNTENFVVGCYVPKTFSVDSIVYKDSKATAFVSFTYTNPKNVDFDRHLQLYLQKDTQDNKYKITGSKGLAAFTNGSIFDFAMKIGAPYDVDDNEMMDNLAISRAFRKELVRQKKTEIDDGWRDQGKYQWWNGTNRINFSGIVTNSANITIPKVKILFDVICDGVVATHMESNIGDVSPGVDYSYFFETFVLQKIQYSDTWNTSFSYKYDPAFIDKYVDNKPYTGKEFEEYKKAHSSELSAIIRANSGRALSGTYYGTVGREAVTMTLNVRNGKVSGSYYYNKNGASRKLSLKGLIQDNGNITMDEYDTKGKNTGTFELDGDFGGSFTNTNGKSFIVKLKQK